MLAIARKFDPRETAIAFKAIVSWAVRFLIVGGGGGGVLDKAYADAAQAVIKDEAKTTKGVYAKLSALIPTDAQFKSGFETAAVSQAFLARYYLRALEARRRNESDTPELVPVTDPTIVNLEHILPKSPTTDNWPDIDQETASAYARRLGNMVLMTARSNSVIGNSPFSEKKVALGASTIELTAEVATHEKWGIAEINERQRMLAILALGTWPLSS